MSNLIGRAAMPCTIVLVMAMASAAPSNASTEQKTAWKTPAAAFCKENKSVVVENKTAREAAGSSLKRNGRYAGVEISPAEMDELCRVIWLEAGNQSSIGQQAVAEVILNRVVSVDFPNSVHEVLHQAEGTRQQQFSTITNLENSEPGETQTRAVKDALYGALILEPDVVYFSRSPENDKVYAEIGDHVFCRGYEW